MLRRSTKKNIPESVRGVVGKIRQQRLVDVEDPRVLPVAGDLDPASERNRVVGDHQAVRRIPLSGHVFPDESDAYLRHLRPDPGVVSLDGEPPALAVEFVALPEAPVSVPATFLRDLEDRMRSSDGEEGEEEEQRPEGVHGGKEKTVESPFRAFRFPFLFFARVPLPLSVFFPPWLCLGRQQMTGIYVFDGGERLQWISLILDSSVWGIRRRGFSWDRGRNEGAS